MIKLALQLWQSYRGIILMVVASVALIGAMMAVVKIYGHTRYLDGRNEVGVVLERERALWQSEYERQKLYHKQAIEDLTLRTKEIDDAWQGRLAAASANVSDLSRRLLHASSRPSDCPVRSDSATGGGGGATGTQPGSLEAIRRDLDQVWTAVAGDVAALGECQAKYEAARRATLRGRGPDTPEGGP